MNKTLAIIFLSAATTFAAPPPNDNFASRIVIPSVTSTSLTGTTVGSTIEPGDPFSADVSVWYSWKAPVSGIARLSSTFTGSDDLRAAISIGTDVLTLKTIARYDTTGGSVGEFYAIAGTTYQICLYTDGIYSNDFGTFVLGLSCDTTIPQNTLYVEPLSNDNFTAPLNLSGSDVYFVQYCRGASFEPFEQNLLKSIGAPNSSSSEGGLWINFAPTITGTAYFSAQSPRGDDVTLVAGQGSSLATYAPVAAAYNAISFPCVAGNTYILYLRSQFRQGYTSISYLQVLARLQVLGQSGNSVATPTISPNGGSFSRSVKVSLKCATSRAVIRYTTNGSEPTASSTKFKRAFTLKASRTVKAKAFKTGLTASTTASAVFTKN